MLSHTLPLCLAFALAASASPVKRATGVTVTVPNGAPSTAKYSYGALVGMSIEQDRFPDWAGQLGSPNEYTMTVLGNIVDRTGVPPPIRVGGNTEDRTTYTSDVQYTNNVYPAATSTTPYPEASTVQIGYDFYSLAGNFPSGTAFTFGINLLSQDSSNAVTEAQQITSAFAQESLQHVSLRYFELGNEPDLYGGGWSISYYVQQWQRLANAITSALGFSSTPNFQILSFANPGSSFNVQNAVNYGILNNGIDAIVKTVSEHHYQGSFCQGSGGAVQQLMQKSYIRSNLSMFDSEIAAAQNLGFDFELGETNSVSCHGAPGLSNTAGAAVWAVDYIFQAAARGVTRLYFHHGVGYKYDFFQPISGISDGTPYSGAHILPLYHALLISAEATSYSGAIYINELSANSDEVAAYGIWAVDTAYLLRVIVINSDAYFSSSGSGRDAYTITLSGIGSGTQYTLRRLTIPSADATSGLTYGQQSFETSSGSPSGTRVDQYVTGNTFSMSATEVVLLMF